MKSSTNLIWLDLEMTGLNPESDHILEIAILVTDKNLHTLAEGPVFAIHQRSAALEKMDEWNVRQHGGSGLIARVKASSITEEMAEDQILAFLEQYVPAGKSPMCGSSICQDRRFLAKFMPKLEKYFHYRNLDVSSVKILAKLWHENIARGWKKTSKHQAMSDIYDSIAELQYYREHLFKRSLHIE